MEKYVRKIELLQWDILVKFCTLLFFVGVLMIFGGAAIGQSYTTITSGLASEASTWQGGNIPDFFGGPRGGDATVQTTDTIWHTGNIEVRGETFTISSGSAFIIYGNILIKNRGILDINGLLICSGQLKTAGGSVISGSGGEVYYGSLGGGTRIPGTVEHTTTEKTWEGSISTDWSAADNWVPNGVPSMENIVISPVATHIPVLNGISVLSSVHLSDAQSSLTITSVGSLTLTESVSNNGIITLESNSSGTGSLITPGATGNGIVNIQRYIPDGLDGDDWHIISSPIKGIDMKTFAENSEVNQPSGYPDYDLAPYDEGYGGWNEYILANGSNSIDFEVGRGYSMRRKLTLTNDYLTFAGNTTDMATGEVGPVAITYSRNGWNALGNPYTSAINIETFLSANGGSISEEPYNVAYLWDPTIGDYIGVGTGHIALGQGFLVKAKTGGGNINFTFDMQEHNSVVLKSADIPCPTVCLSATTENLQNITTVKFSKGMTDGLDSKRDIGKFKGNPDIALYTRMPNSSAYDLQDQVLPELGFDTKTIPVGLDFIPGGEVTFSVETKSLPEYVKVILEDTETGAYTLLNEEDAKYTTHVVAESHGTGRFNLIVGKQTQTGIKLDNDNLFTIYNQNKIIYINGPVSVDTQMELYSIEGRCWYKSNAQNQNQNQIDGSAFPAGVYILRLNHLGRVQSSKFVLTEN